MPLRTAEFESALYTDSSTAARSNYRVLASDSPEPHVHDPLPEATLDLA